MHRWILYFELLHRSSAERIASEPSEARKAHKRHHGQSSQGHPSAFPSSNDSDTENRKYKERGNRRKRGGRGDRRGGGRRGRFRRGFRRGRVRPRGRLYRVLFFIIKLYHHIFFVNYYNFYTFERSDNEKGKHSSGGGEERSLGLDDDDDEDDSDFETPPHSFLFILFFYKGDILSRIEFILRDSDDEDVDEGVEEDEDVGDVSEEERENRFAPEPNDSD